MRARCRLRGAARQARPALRRCRPPGRWSSSRPGRRAGSASSTSWVTQMAVTVVRVQTSISSVLQLPARQRVEHAEGLVEQQQLRRQREARGRCRRAASCRSEISAARLSHGIRRGRRGRDSTRRCRGARPALGLRINLGRRRERRSRRAVSHGSRLGAWKTTARSGPGASTSRPSSTMPPLEIAFSPAAIDEHGRLAAAGMADERDELALVHLEVEAVDDGQRALAASG